MGCVGRAGRQYEESVPTLTCPRFPVLGQREPAPIVRAVASISRFLPLDSKDPLRLGDPLELDHAALPEPQIPSALGELLEQRRDQDLSPARLGSDARGEDHGLAEEFVRVLQDLAGVKADPLLSKMRCFTSREMLN